MNRLKKRRKRRYRDSSLVVSFIRSIFRCYSVVKFFVACRDKIFKALELILEIVKPVVKQPKIRRGNNRALARQRSSNRSPFKGGSIATRLTQY